MRECHPLYLEYNDKRKEIMIEYLYMWERIQLDGKRL